MMIHTDEVYYTPVVTASDVTALEYYHMWYVTDHQGNIRAVTDGTGTVLRTNHYDPYGEEVLPVLTSASTLPTSTAGTDAASRYMYGAKEWDSNVSLYDFSARWYNPTRAVSFTTMDPLCEKYYGISPYAYCAGNPVNLVDPEGMDWFYYSVDGKSSPTWNWRDEEEYHTGVFSDDGQEIVLTGAKAVVVFNGARFEQLGTKGGIHYEDGGIPATVTMYGPKGSNDITHYTGYTMTSDAEKYVPIAEGIYECNYMDPGKGGALSSHWALNKGGIIPTMDGIPNTSPYADDNYGKPQKTGIYIHRTNSKGRASSTVSTGCLLIADQDWNCFCSKLKGLSSFRVQVTRRERVCEIMGVFGPTGIYYQIIRK